jgi:PAS domain S-box-containing protein
MHKRLAYFGVISAPVRFGIAVGLAILAILARLSLDPLWGIRLPYITLFPAIMLAAWLGGFWPGVVTTAISGAAAFYFWVAPVRTWEIADRSDWIGLIVFGIVGLVISALNEAWRRATTDVQESERRLDATLGSIGDAVLATDAAGRVIRLNPVAERLTGWSSADALGRDVQDVLVLINELTRAAAKNPIERVLREGERTGLANHTMLIARDGREIPIDDSAAPIRTADGHIAGVVMVFRDISDRRRAEQAQQALTRELEEARRFLEDAESIAQLGSWAWDIPTNRVTWSDEMYRVYGFEPGSHTPTYEAFLSYVHPDDRATVETVIRRSFETNEPFAFDHRIIRPDGTERTLHGKGRVIIGPDGRPLRMVGSGHDITEQASIRAQRERLVHELVAANEVKMAFLTRMSHELRTPLNAIDGYAELLTMGIRGPVTPEQQKDLERIRHSSKFLLTLINDILDFAKLEAGQTALQLAEFRIGTLLATIEQIVAPQAALRGITYRQSPFDDVVVRADEARVRQVVVNLLSNAIKFTDRGGQVTVACRADERFAWVSISDTGYGIPADQISAIFEPFVQVKSQASDPTGHAGLGLGLSISRDLVRQMGGDIAVASTVGKGSEFRFSLLRPPSLPEFRSELTTRSRELTP